MPNPSRTSKYRRVSKIVYKNLSAEIEFIVGEIMDDIHTNYRVALHLFYKEEKTYNEIATIMKIPENTVKSHIFRGKEAIRKILAKKFPLDSPAF